MLPRTVSISEFARVIHHLPSEYTFFHGQETAQSTAYLSAASMNGKLGDIGDIAPIVRFLVTEGWWINGQTVFANGGFTTRCRRLLATTGWKATCIMPLIYHVSRGSSRSTLTHVRVAAGGLLIL